MCYRSRHFLKKLREYFVKNTLSKRSPQGNDGRHMQLMKLEVNEVLNY